MPSKGHFEVIVPDCGENQPLRLVGLQTDFEVTVRKDRPVELFAREGKLAVETVFEAGKNAMNPAASESWCQTLDSGKGITVMPSSLVPLETPPDDKTWDQDLFKSELTLPEDTKVIFIVAVAAGVFLFLRLLGKRKRGQPK